MDDILSVSVMSLVESKKAVTYWALNSDTLQVVLDKLRKYNIISLPILNHQGKVLGILSVLDIAVYMTWGADDITFFRSLVMRAGDILGFWSTTKKSGEDAFVCNGNTSLFDLLEPFSNGAHRVLVPFTDPEEGSTYRILSQSDVVRYLWNNKYKFSSITEKSLCDLGITAKPVVCITTNTKAVVGFRTMVQEKVPAVAIVDIETQHIVGTLSASDLRGLSDNTTKLFYNPVCEFLISQHDGVLRKPVVVTLSTPLQVAMELIVVNKIHRTWIVDSVDDPKPCGCLSLTDVINIFKQ